MSLLVTAGRAGDAPQFPAVMDAITVLAVHHQAALTLAGILLRTKP